MKNLIEEIKRYLKSSGSKIDKDTYIKIQTELGRPIEPEKMPLYYEDLSEFSKRVVSIFLSMSRVVTEVGVTGVDKCILFNLMDEYEIKDKKFCIDLIAMIESDMVDKSQKARQKEMDKLSSKNKK